MQQATRRLVFVLSGTFLVAGGMLAVACSTDNGTTSGGLPTIDAAKPDNNSSSGNPDTGGPNDGGTDPDCQNAPFLHDAGGSTTFFCPFVKDGGDCTETQICCNPGIPLDAATPFQGDGGFPPSFCANDPTKGSNNTNSLREEVCHTAATANQTAWEPGNHFNSFWECADKTNCPANNVCCAVTAADVDAAAGDKVNVGTNQDKNINQACQAKQLFKTSGSRCATACSTTEIQLCSLADNNCTGGLVCKPVAGSATSKSSTRDLGYCAVP